MSNKLEKYKVFYCKDCAMYGVEKLIIDNGSGRKMFWQQVVPTGNRGARHGESAYTRYKGVAERWAKEFNEVAK